MCIKKKLPAAALITVITVSVLAGIVWGVQNYRLVGFRLYPKNEGVLDLREETVTPEQYRKLSEKLPDSRVLWNVPVQGGAYSSDTTHLTLPDLAREEIPLLSGFSDLKTLELSGCQDPAVAAEIQKTYPKLKVLYTVAFGDREYPQDTKILTLDAVEVDTAERIACLPELTRVRLEGGGAPEALNALTEICRERSVSLRAVLGGEEYDLNVTGLSVDGLTEKEALLLPLLPRLKNVHLTHPRLSPEALTELVRQIPSARVTWEVEILGVSYPQDTTRVDLTAGMSPEGAQILQLAKNAPVQGQRDEELYQFGIKDKYFLPDLSADTPELLTLAERAVAYLPELEEVIFGGGLLDNENMLAFREEHRQDYKVIWYVQCGNKMMVRTDSPYLMPTKYHVYYFLDRDAVNLKYCEDMVSIDLGHMAISNIDWVENMPDLQYLVLAHTQLQYIEPIRNCKNLKFLELDWSPIRDYSPLVECTALEDLNLGETYADSTPVGKMTWLKNLWMVHCSSGSVYRMTQALPDTRIVAGGNATVAGGWRSLPNYYAMRDRLGMYYMTW